MTRLENGYDATALVEKLIAERDHARAVACHYEEIVQQMDGAGRLGFVEHEPARASQELAHLRCPVCAGTTSHVLGCPEQDRPR